jgi:phage-related protein
MADFSYRVDQDVEEKIEFDTIISQFENGVEQRRVRSSIPNRTFLVKTSNADLTEMQNIRNFFISKRGSTDSFSWTNPIDSTDYTVRFAEKSFRVVILGPGVFDLYFNFEVVK